MVLESDQARADRQRLVDALLQDDAHRRNLLAPGLEPHDSGSFRQGLKGAGLPDYTVGEWVALSGSLLSTSRLLALLAAFFLANLAFWVWKSASYPGYLRSADRVYSESQLFGVEGRYEEVARTDPLSSPARDDRPRARPLPVSLAYLRASEGSSDALLDQSLEELEKQRDYLSEHYNAQRAELFRREFRPLSFVDEAVQGILAWGLTLPAIFSELSATETKPINPGHGDLSQLQDAAKRVDFDADAPRGVSRFWNKLARQEEDREELLRSQDPPALEPAAGWPYTKPLTVLIDMDLLGTLKTQPGRGVLYMARPNVEHFVARVAPYAEVVLISTTMPLMEAEPHCDRFDPFRQRFACLGKEHCDRVPYKRAIIPTEERRIGRPQSKVVILDAHYRDCGRHCDNVLLLSPWFGKDNDSAMLDVIPFFQFMALASAAGHDVRDIVVRYKNMPIDQIMKYVTQLVEREYASSAKLDSHDLPFTAREEKILNDFLAKHSLVPADGASGTSAATLGSGSALPDPAALLAKLPANKNLPLDPNGGARAPESPPAAPFDPVEDLADPFQRPTASPFDPAFELRPHPDQLAAQARDKAIAQLPRSLQALYRSEPQK